MFPTFSGSSRRPRNVNLSGQRNTNPFASHALTPASGTGVTKAVAEAKAGRRQRQQERNELKAARKIQRVWRGHKVRQSVKAEHRQALAELYGPHATVREPTDRVPIAFPLVLSSFDMRKLDECMPLLQAFADDMAWTEYAALSLGQLPVPRLGPLVQMLLQVLNELNRAPTPSRPPELFQLLVRVVQFRPQSLRDGVDAYYTLLAEYAADDAPQKDDMTSLVESAVSAPLAHSPGTTDPTTTRAYAALPTSFLTHPLPLLERHPARFAQGIDVAALCEAVVGVYRTPKHRRDRTAEERLWLLAHVIGLQRSIHGDETRDTNSPRFLGAVYTLLSDLSEDIKLRLPSFDDQGSADGTADYVVTQIQSLVNKDEITALLAKFSAMQSTGADEQYASLLAGYAIALIRCFPSKGDDIRMQFYLADLPTQSGPQPAIQFFWEASRATQLFAQILPSPSSALAFLLQRKTEQHRLALEGGESAWDREWRTVLLFLELYTFVLRLTDDDDFFSAFEIDGVTTTARRNASRLRASALSLDALKTLTIFLKHLAFTLHYNAAELLQDSGSTSATAGAAAAAAAANAFSASHGQGGRRRRRPGNYHVLSGLDFQSFKGIVTTAIQMLYERDSRRQFLPTDHWLMTSSFDLAQFLPAVVSEEQRQHELQQEHGDSDDEADDEKEEEEEEEEEGGHAHGGDGGEDVQMGEDGGGRLRRDSGGLVAYSQYFARTSRYAMLEKLRQKRQMSQRERLLATIGPKLEILRNMPYVLPFETRVRIFREFVQLDKVRRREGNVEPDAWRAHIMARHGNWAAGSESRAILSRHSGMIQRNAMFESAFSAFWELGEGLKEPIQITFLDEHGNEEAGIDGGGVTKEFLTCALTDALSPEYELFETNEENALFPNPMLMDQTKEELRLHGVAEGSGYWNETIGFELKRYEFLGRMVGKSLYEGILLDYVFAGFFLRKWTQQGAGYRASINDLREMDEGLYQGMLQLKNYDAGADVAELDLDFTIADQVSKRGQPLRTVTRPLVPNGAAVRVTNENRPLYVSYVARHRLAAQPHAVTQAFLRGLWLIVDPLWLRMFNQSELQRLVGGDSSPVDVEDLRRHTLYSGVYAVGDDGAEHPTVQLFWAVVRDMADSDRRLLLKYVTSTPRAPLLGFGQLRPAFCIRDAGSDETRLPSASTCVNLLKLPRYKTRETLEEKLLYAIRANARFDLS